MSYRALVRLFAGMPSHMNDQHVLGFKRFLVARTLFPATDKALLVGVDVVVVDVLDQIVLRGKLFVAIPPVTVRLDKVARFVFHWITRAVFVHRLASGQD